MSVIAARVWDGYVTIAADSITVWGYTQEKKSAKLFQAGDLIIGGCGESRQTALLRLYCDVTRPRTAEVHDMLTFMTEFETWAKKKVNTADEFDNMYLLVFRNKLFFYGSYHIQELDDYGAIGAGQDYALAALHLGHTPEEAVDVACELSIYCERPIQVFRSQD